MHVIDKDSEERAVPTRSTTVSDRHNMMSQIMLGLTLAFVITAITLGTIGFIRIDNKLFVLEGELVSLERHNVAVVENVRLNTDIRIIYLKILILKSDIDRPLAKEIADSIHKHCKAYGKDPDLIVAMARAESNFAPKEIGRAGAIGLLQVMKSWVGEFEDPCDLTHVDCNVRNGIRLLSSYERLYNGDLERALLVYNRGPSSVDIALSRGQNPANGYVENIMKFYKQLKEM